MTPKKEGAKRYGDGRAAVIAHADAIRAWLASGRTLRSYFDDHEAELAISYVQLTRLTRSYVQAKRPKPAGPSRPGQRHDHDRQHHPEKPPTRAPTAPTNQPGTIPTFSHATGKKVDPSELF